MSVLSYYRDRLRGWGSQDLSFATPPPLTYSPRPHWGGLHHYMAHASAVEPNPEIYELAMERAESGTLGVGLHEARHFHRHAYGGLLDLSRLSPAELGHAAAYEAFRYLLHHESLYEPLAGEAEHEREVLLSLAVAEATRLCSEAPRLNDEYGLQSACSSAAATASLLYSQKLDIAELGPGHLSQRNARRPYGDAYAEDDKALCERAGLAEPERGRMYGRSAYGGSAYGGRSGRALSEGPSYGGRDHVGGAGTDGMGMAGSNIGGTGMVGTGMADSRDPRSQLGGIGSPPYAPSRVGTSIGMPDSPITGGASSYGGPPYPTDIPGSPYPARSVNSSYPTGAGGFAPSGVPDIQRAGSPILPGRGMDPTGFMPGSAYGAGFNQQANSTMPLQTGGQPGYPGLGGQAQPSYGGIYAASGQMHQPAYATNGAAGGMPQTVMNGAPGAMSQGGYGGVPVTGGMPGTMSGTMPQAAYGGVPQSIPGCMPGAMPQVPYNVAPPMLAHAAIPGAQVYPPGSTIVLPSRKKRRYRTRARSRDLAERDRYYRERRSGQQDGYESY